MPDNEASAGSKPPWASRWVTLGLEPSFGFGDRTGLATPGHVAAMRAAGGSIQPILAQQSIREMKRTGRMPSQVVRDAWQGLEAAGWVGPVGADADHLKTTADVDATAEVGFTFFTLDPSDHVDPSADDYDVARLEQLFGAMRSTVPWIDQYVGKTVRLDSGSTIELTAPVCWRAAVKYGRAIAAAVELARHIDAVQGAAGRPYEIELSVDETPQPTTLAEHYIIADQCLRFGMKLVSLAPRFVGEFEKGVDFKGSIEALEHSLRDHAAIARQLGPYKLSLHSGSDKLSIYGPLARATSGRFHVKTAGTSYLEALRVAARHAPDLFRRIVRFARQHYDRDRATYHVSARLEHAPPPDEVADERRLEREYLGLWDEVPPGRGFTNPGRQIVHCTFGSVLADAQLGPELLDVLRTHSATYAEVLEDHFVRHLRPLQV